MGSFQNPVGNGPRDPFDDRTFRVEPVEEDQLARNEKPKEFEEPPSQQNLGIASFFIQLFRSVTDFILSRPTPPQTDTLTPRGSLIRLKEALETLKKEDRSQDVSFLNEMSRIWRYAIEHAIHFKNDAAIQHLRSLIKAIQHYPESEPHTFGYYLTENTHQKWVPFPYMELIQKIHLEHLKNQELSALSQWTNLLDELLSLLKEEGA